MKSVALYIFFLSTCLHATAVDGKGDALRRKYPHSILTPHYEILSEADLALDAKTYVLGPYEPEAIGGSFWQCFATREVAVGFDKWRDADSMGRFDVIITMCSLDIRVRGSTIWSDYWDRRGHPVEFCKDLVSAWKKLSRNERFVCLNGEAAGLETKIIKGVKHLIRGWVWNKFKTKKGCYSYFESACLR